MANEQLEALNKFNNKSDGWLQVDLTQKKSTWLGRLFWIIIGKRFDFIRRYFYGVDLVAAKATLLNHRCKIFADHNPQLIILFNQAVHRFNTFFPKHGVAPIEVPTEVAFIEDHLSTFSHFQNLTSALDASCIKLEGKHNKQGGCLVNRILPKSYSYEDLAIFQTIQENLVQVKEMALSFREQRAVTEASIFDHILRVKKLRKTFKQDKTLKLKKPRQKALLRAVVSQATDSLVQKIGGYVYTHLPTDVPCSFYYTPWSSHASIFGRLKRCSCLGPADPDMRRHFSGYSSYCGFGINFDYTVFGKRCTLISLQKEDTQYEETLRRLDPTTPPMSALKKLTQFLDDPAYVKTLEFNQRLAREKFERLEALSIVYEENYGAYHFPTENELVEHYKLPLPDIAKFDFIVFYHRPFEIKCSDFFQGAPFDQFKKFRIRLLDTDFEETERQIRHYKIEECKFVQANNLQGEDRCTQILEEYELLKKYQVQEEKLKRKYPDEADLWQPSPETFPSSIQIVEISPNEKI